MYKVTVLYHHPIDPEAFEKYYSETHIPIAQKIKNLNRVEATKFMDGPEGKAAYFIMGELSFASSEDMQAALASPEGQAAVSDIANFATGGATFLLGSYEIH